MPRLITFHRILAGCEEGSREAWQAFLSGYTPIVYQLLGVYFPLTREAQERFWRESLEDLARNHYERLRTFDHQAEREFLYDLRTFLLERGASRLDPSQDTEDAPRPTLETVGALIKGLAFIHQEIVLVKMAGYSNASLEKFFRITPSMAQKGLERLRTKYSIILERPDDKCLWPAAWAEVLRSARAAKTPDCPPLRQFVRILDGQSGWYDKEPTEEHISLCAHCLEHWIALREIIYWRREAQPLPPAEVDALLSCLPLKAENKRRKTFLERMFG